MQKGRHNGQDVAAKGLRLYPKDNFELIKGVGCWPCSWLVICIDKQPRLVEVLQGGCDMEGAPPSELAAALRCDDDRESARGRIGVDDKR